MNLHRLIYHNIHFRQYLNIMFHYICETRDRLQLFCEGSVLDDIVLGTYEHIIWLDTVDTSCHARVSQSIHMTDFLSVRLFTWLYT